MFDVNRLAAIQVGLASPDKIREWSYGEVKKPETINYRSQKPERDGLFCEKIFGPSKDYECYCGKYKKIRFSGIVCEKCGVEVTTKSVRRERMGHIDLATPVAHIWYLKGIPSRMAQILDVAPKQLEEVIYFISHICTNPGSTNNLLRPREVLDEKDARNRFILIIRDLQERVEMDLIDKQRSEELLARLENPNEVFDFYTNSNFIAKYTGAEFGIGAEAIQRLLKEVDLDAEFSKVQEELKETSTPKCQKRQKFLKRLEVLESFRQSRNSPEWMILDVLPVIPPELRPMLPLDGGRFATSDLNDLYRRVITRNIRLKKLLEIRAPNVILMNEKRMLQEAVDALIDNGRRAKPVTGAAGRTLKSLSHTLKGKQGRFRQNLLGKRVDYSGRSVIAVGPSLKMHQCGIPREMAVQLFKPFIASRMIRAGIVSGHKAADRMIERQDERVWSIVEELVKERPVLLNRAPTLHRLGIQAFEPVLVEGRAIRLHPLVTPAFNADFDGDQMAVHVPLSKYAVHEARTLMLGSKNILGPKDGKPIVTPSQDMVLGNYYLSLEENEESLLQKADEAEAAGNHEKAERYRIYAEAEGKVFSTQEDVILAYQNKKIHIHNHVALKAVNMHNPSFTAEQNKGYFMTTVGKVIFNQILPKDFPFLNEASSENFIATPARYFVKPGQDLKEAIKNNSINQRFKKKHLGLIINEVFSRYHETEPTFVPIMLDKMKDLGFKYATLAGVTVSIDDIPVVENKKAIYEIAEEKVQQYRYLYEKGLLTDDERHKRVIVIWEEVKGQIQKTLNEQLNDVLNNPNNPANPIYLNNPIYMMADSGARGNASHFLQLSGMRGLMSNPTGGTIELPIKSSFREGLTVSEFFISTHGARKGGADTALKTAESGYLTRRLVDVAQDVIVREEDCGTDRGTVVSAIVESFDGGLIENLYDRLVGRYPMNDILHPKTGEIIVTSDEMIDEKKAQKVIDSGIKEVEIRTLFGCQAVSGVCKRCYGRNLATGLQVEIGESVGIMAAQSIGEPGTQLTMRTFHTGGVAGGIDITQGLPRVQELFEARNPKGEAVISEIAGTIMDIKEDKETGRSEVLVKNDLEEKSYTTPFNSRLRVKKGDKVVNGQKITEGAINPKHLLEATDIQTVQNYILKEVQKVYRPRQGIEISDKHIEVVVRQMFRKVLVIEGGDTPILPGARLDIFEFTRINSDVLLEGKRPAIARPLILGITKASLETESFLSAASFQETTRVLTDAATKGKIDYLHGLKENVIIGKMIPAGTGLRQLILEETAIEMNEDEG